MTDYLARALEQGEEEERDADVFSDGPFRVVAGASPRAAVSEGAQKAGPAKETEEAAHLRRIKNMPAGGTSFPEEQTVGKIFQQAEVIKEGAGRARAPRATFGSAPTRRARKGADDSLPYKRITTAVELPLLSALRRAETGAEFVSRERRNLSVTLPEAPTVAGSLSAEELDRMVERDARRYDGGFSLY